MKEASPPVSHLRGSLWMLAYCALFAVVASVVRVLSQSISTAEIVFFRTAIIVAAMLLWRRRGRGDMTTHRMGIHFLRAVATMLATLLLFYSYTLIPIAEATALTFTAPLFATLGAVLIFKEKLGLRRGLIMAASFAGMLIILRPGARLLDPGSLYTLAGALCIAANMLMIVSLHKTDSSNAIVLYNALLMLPMSLALALFFWQTPTWSELGGLLLMGCLALGVQQCMTRAFGGGQATPILPLDFTRLIFAAALGFLLFGEKLDLWTWVGGAVTFACTVFLVRSEAKPNLHLSH